MNKNEKKHQQISIIDVKNIEEFKNINDREAMEIIETINLLAQIIYDNYKPKSHSNIKISQHYLKAA